MRKLLGILFILFFYFPIAVEAGYMSLRFALYMQPSSISYQDVFLPFVENVKRQSHGRLNIDLYPSGVLSSNPSEQAEMVRHEYADIAVVIPLFSPEDFPGFELTQIPGLIHNSTEGSVAFWQTYESMDRLSSRGLRILSIFVTPPDIIHSNRPIIGINSLKRLKFRVNAGTKRASFATELIGDAVELPFSETFMALQRGFLDGAIMSWYSAEQLRLYEVMKHQYNLPMGSSMVALVMNENRFRSFSPDIQEVISRNSGEMLARTWGNVYDKQNLSVIDRFRSEGCILNEMNEQDKALLERQVNRWIDSLPKRSVEIMQKFSEKLKVQRGYK